MEHKCCQEEGCNRGVPSPSLLAHSITWLWPPHHLMCLRQVWGNILKNLLSRMMLCWEGSPLNWGRLGNTWLSTDAALISLRMLFKYFQLISADIANINIQTSSFSYRHLSSPAQTQNFNWYSKYLGHWQLLSVSVCPSCAKVYFCHHNFIILCLFCLLFISFWWVVYFPVDIDELINPSDHDNLQTY